MNVNIYESQREPLSMSFLLLSLVVLATCGIRSPVEAFEYIQSRLLLHVLPIQIRGSKGALAKASDYP